MIHATVHVATYAADETGAERARAREERRVERERGWSRRIEDREKEQKEREREKEKDWKAGSGLVDRFCEVWFNSLSGGFRYFIATSLSSLGTNTSCL